MLYEDLWYRGTDFVGCRRFSSLPIIERKTVDARVGFDRPIASLESSGAVANAASRILLDCSLNVDTLTQVQIPADNYMLVSEQLRRAGFYPYEQVFRTVSANIPMNLRSADGKSVLLLYGETR